MITHWVAQSLWFQCLSAFQRQWIEIGGIRYYEFKEEDKYDYDASKVKKIIYKNPDDEFGYVVEFDNVINKDRKFKVHNDSFGLSYSDKYDIGEEIKLK